MQEKSYSDNHCSFTVKEVTNNTITEEKIQSNTQHCSNASSNIEKIKKTSYSKHNSSTTNNKGIYPSVLSTSAKVGKTLMIISFIIVVVVLVTFLAYYKSNTNISYSNLFLGKFQTLNSKIVPFSSNSNVNGNSKLSAASSSKHSNSQILIKELSRISGEINISSFPFNKVLIKGEIINLAPHTTYSIYILETSEDSIKTSPSVEFFDPYSKSKECFKSLNSKSSQDSFDFNTGILGNILTNENGVGVLDIVKNGFISNITGRIFSISNQVINCNKDNQVNIDNLTSESILGYGVFQLNDDYNNELNKNDFLNQVNLISKNDKLNGKTISYFDEFLKPNLKNNIVTNNFDKQTKAPTNNLQISPGLGLQTGMKLKVSNFSFKNDN